MNFLLPLVFHDKESSIMWVDVSFHCQHILCLHLCRCRYPRRRRRRCAVYVRLGNRFRGIWFRIYCYAKAASGASSGGCVTHSKCTFFLSAG